MNRNQCNRKWCISYLHFSLSGYFILSFLFFVFSFTVTNETKASNFAVFNKDTSIIICDSFFDVSNLGLITQYAEGKWKAVSSTANIGNSNTFNTVFSNLSTGNSTFIWTSTNTLEMITIRISNRKPKANIFKSLDNEVKGGNTCLKRITLSTANPQKTVPTARGGWVTIHQPVDNLASLAYLNQVISRTGDSIATLAYNLNATGTYQFGWVVNEPTCGTDTAKLIIISKRNAASIIVSDPENKSTCGLPVPVATVKIASSSIGNWKIGRKPIAAQNPVISFQSSTSSIINYSVQNFSKPGIFDLWWVVNSLNINECPSDSQLISIVNIKPLAETEYTSQFIDVCGSTMLKAKNPTLSGIGLTGSWIVDKKPSNAPEINTSNFTFNSNVNFPKTGNYYFKWFVKKDLSTCVSDTVEVIFNNIKPSSVSAGLDTTICSTFYGLAADQNLEGLSIPCKGVWSIYYQPAQKDVVLLDNNLSAKTIVRNLNAIGHYEFIWSVTTSSASVANCISTDTVYIFNFLHSEFVISSTPTSFCDTLKLLPPVREFPKSKIVPIESWKISDNSAITKDIVILNEPNNSFKAIGFNKPGIYNFEYSFSFSGCVQKTIMSALNLKASAIDIRNSGKEFCKDTIQLSAPLIESGFRGRWETVSYPPLSAPSIRDSSKGNTTVKGFSKPGLYKFRWVLFPATSTIQCLRSSDTIVYTNKKASKLPDSYRTDTSFCGPLLKLKTPVLDPTFLIANSGWNILDAPATLSKTVKGDTTIFSNWGKPNKLKVIWLIANTDDLSCQRIDTITRINQQPMLINAAGSDIEVCGKNSMATMNSKINLSMPLTKGTWKLINKPLGANNPLFVGDSTATNIIINGFNKPGIYKFEWTLKNWNCTEKDEVLITNNLPDTIYANAITPSTCKPFDSIRGYNLRGLEPFKNAKYSWRIINQPIDKLVSEIAILEDTISPTCYISGMFVIGIYKIEYTIKNGNCVAKDTAIINRSKRFDAVVTKREYYTCEDSVLIKAIPEGSIPGKWKLVSGATKHPKTISDNGAEAIVFGLTYAENNLFDWVVSPPGCEESRATVVVKKYKKPPNIKFSFKTVRVCEQDTITINAISHTASEGKSEWIYNNATLSNQDNYRVTSLKYGSSVFRYRLVQPNLACFSNSDSITVWRDRTFEGNIKLKYEKNICLDTVQLSVPMQIFATYKWTPLITNPTLIPELPSFNTVQANNLKIAGTYKIALKISRESCSFLDTAIITRGNSPSPAIITNQDYKNGDTICESEITKKYTYIASPINKGKGFWTFNNVTLPKDTTTKKVVELSLGKNQILWTTTVDETCLSQDQQMVIVIAPPPKAVAGNNKIVYAPSGSLGALYLTQIPENKAQWIQSPTNSTQIADPNKPNSDYYNLPIGKNVFYWKIDNGKCPAEIDTLWITRLESKIPKGFSPNNGDFVNNEFVITGLEEYETSDLSVFNRWGDLVYENKKYNNEWKGESKDGKILPDDTYYYILKLGKDHEIKDYVVIKR